MRLIIACLFVLSSVTAAHGFGFPGLDWTIKDTSFLVHRAGDSVITRLYLRNSGTIDEYFKLRLTGANILGWSIVTEIPRDVEAGIMLPVGDTIWVDVKYVASDLSGSTLQLIAAGMYDDDTVTLTARSEQSSVLQNSTVVSTPIWNGKGLRLDMEDDFNLIVYDLRGAIAHHREHSAFTEVVPLEALPPGQYYVLVSVRSKIVHKIALIKD